MKTAARILSWLLGQGITAFLAALAIVMFLPSDPARVGKGAFEAEQAPTPAQPLTRAAADVGDSAASSSGGESGATQSVADAEPPVRSAPAIGPAPTRPRDVVTSASPSGEPQPEEQPDDAFADDEVGGDIETAAEEEADISEPASTPDAATSSGPAPFPLPVSANQDAVDPQSAAGRCQDKRLLGVSLDKITDDDEELCGVELPVQLDAVAAEGRSVEFRPALVINCDVAVRTADWVERYAAPTAQAAFDEPLAAITTASGYSCRRRNNGGPLAKISEHAFGNAVDLSAFLLESGRRVTLLEGWSGDPKEAVFLRKLWDGACRLFGTVLGPDANEAHRDHFHFDAAKRRRAFCE